MDTRLAEVISGREENYLLPFFWMHDGHREELPALVRQVYDSGCRALCVESRPHNGFGGEEWWGDMDLILETAEELGMKVWILDDYHFPTGYANGLVAKKYPERRRRHLVEDHMDCVGPAPDNAILLNTQAEDTLIGVYAYRRAGADETLSDECVDLTDHVKGRYVYWDIPKGIWRVVALYDTTRGCQKGQEDYITQLDPSSVDVLIEAVYEPHYEHYKKYFGNTLAGFFSDEPCFGSDLVFGQEHGAYDRTLGQPGLALPWTKEVGERMRARLGTDPMPRLAGLWFSRETADPEVRVAYMDAITRLWEENFSFRLGDWCRARGVEYIGHVIEDMDAHMRISSSGGHFFRALRGQDMAGIDVVLHQIIPGISRCVHSAVVNGGYTDPAFFDYILARMAASQSHIEPHKRGRAMCEIFGAFGWAEGVPYMKHLMDHMLVRGINRFVPHAFSPDYPDPDCPPHFGGGWDNPEFEPFACLMRYTNRAAHLLEGGTEQVSAAILYMAEAEWSGKPYMPVQKVAIPLYNAQMNYDILPIDVFDSAEVRDGILRIGGMRYPALIVPAAGWLPEAFLGRLRDLEAQGLKLFFAGTRPEGCSCGTLLAPEELVPALRELGAQDVSLKEPFPLLRVFHTKRDGADVFMIVNESMEDVFDGTLCLPLKGTGVEADLRTETYYTAHAEDGTYPLRLERGDSTVLIFGTALPQAEEKPVYGKELPLDAEWTLSLRRAHGDGSFSEPVRLEHLYDVTGPEGDDTFSGIMRYEAVFEAAEEICAIDLGRVGECAHLTLNGIDLGWRIDAPYRWDLKGAWKTGENRVRVDVAATLVREQPDPMSHWIQIPPSGLLGPVRGSRTF